MTIRSGLFFVDWTGRIVRLDAGSARLLALADRGTEDGAAATSLPDWLAPILHDLDGTSARRPIPPQPVERVTPAGRFVVRAYPLKGLRPNRETALISVCIDHYETGADAIDAIALRYGLSARQRRVCIEILNGASYAEIGCVLGIKESTVIDHARRIYEKLGVHSRDALRRKLS